jgi:ubiquitin
MKHFLITTCILFHFFGTQANLFAKYDLSGPSCPWEEITVKIKMPNGKTFDLKVDTSDEVIEVMYAIEAVEGVLMQDYMMTFDSEVMMDGYGLSSYEVKDQSVLEIVSKEQPEIEISVRTLTGEPMTFELTAYQTIDDLKELINSKQGIVKEKQRLIFAGKDLEDKRTLKYYKIEEGSVVRLVVR